MQLHRILQKPAQFVTSLGASVVRRGVMLLIITVPAALMNLGLSYLASKWLAADEFGIYYTSITAINIAFAPATIMNLFFTRAITTVGAERGAAHAKESVEKVFRLIAAWGAAVSLALLALAALAWGVGAGFSVLVACGVVLVIYLSYCAEVGRIALQSGNRFFTLGLYTLGWMTSRFIGGALGIYVMGNVWGGLLGIAVATLLPVFSLFRPWKMAGRRFFRPWAGEEGTEQGLLAMIRFRTFAKLSAGFILFMVVAHADILAAYRVLTPEQLTVYSASAVLPKGMLVLTLPLLQLLFPLIVGERASARPTRMLILRGAFLTLAVSAAGAFMIDLLSGPLCTSSYGIDSCDSGVMRMGLIAIVLMCVLRLAISVDYASHLDWAPLTLTFSLGVAALALFPGADWSPQSLSTAYFYFSSATLFAYCVVSIAIRLSLNALRRAAPPTVG